MRFTSKGLNPCSNGICSLTRNLEICEEILQNGLNPCSNGICSLTICEEILQNEGNCVLILVLMEYAL